MLEVVLSSIVLIVVLIEAYLSNMRAKVLIEKVTAEGDLLKENLNHLAGAIISMSELLDDADEVIENISKVPTVGEMIQQALVGFVTQKIQGTIPAEFAQPTTNIIEGVIKGKEVQEDYGKTQNKTETLQE
tara:strand:- start:630 stop:1022 length:393 start_codon:yes stop_codon:yes gene_type:complete